MAQATLSEKTKKSLGVTNPTDVAGDDAEGNLVYQGRFLAFEGVELPAIFRNLEVSPINAEQAIVVDVVIKTIVEQNLSSKNMALHLM